jgi:hypothetical protein
MRMGAMECVESRPHPQAFVLLTAQILQVA